MTDSAVLKVWTHNKFTGHYPVGTAAVVVAEIGMELVYVEGQPARIDMAKKSKP